MKNRTSCVQSWPIFENLKEKYEGLLILMANLIFISKTSILFRRKNDNFVHRDVVRIIKLQEDYLYYDSNMCNINWPSSGKINCNMFMIACVSHFCYQVRRADTERLWIVAPGDCTAHSNHRSVLRLLSTSAASQRSRCTFVPRKY